MELRTSKSTVGGKTVKPLILITGSSGLIGRKLSHHFSERFTVVGLDREGPPYPPEMVHWLFVDLSSDESVQNAMHIVETRYGGKIVSVLHLAAYYDFSGKPSDLYDKITVRGTERLLRELKNFQVEQFVFSSSMLVHAPGRPGDLIAEESPLQATWDYPRSKIETEQLIKDQFGEMPTVILRIAGVYDSYCDSIPIANQISRIVENRLTGHLYPGNLQAAQSFVHLDDLADAFNLVLDKRHELPPYLVLLIGEDQAVSYGELQEIIAEELDKTDWLTATIPKPIAKVGAWVQKALPGENGFIEPWMVDRADDCYQLDTTLARQFLGWKPKHQLRQEIPKIVERLKADPLQWYVRNKLSIPDWLQRRSA